MTNTFHLAIIPDGNRRWARKTGLKGYGKLYNIAIKGLVDITETAFANNVTHLTMWGSSHANLADRSSDFSVGIDRAFRVNVRRFSEHPVIEKYDVQVNIIGEWRDSLSKKTVEAFENVIEKTAHHNSRQLTLLIDYSGSRERDAAVQSAIANPKDNVTSGQLLRSRSWTGHLPDLDLLIRTGAWEDPHNSAGFLSLLADETQLAFPKLYWPDFSSEDLRETINDYNTRERRHGK